MEINLDTGISLIAILGVAAVWGDLRRQVRGLTEEVQKQNAQILKIDDRIVKIEGKAGVAAEGVAQIRGFLESDSSGPKPK